MDMGTVFAVAFAVGLVIVLFVVVGAPEVLSPIGDWIHERRVLSQNYCTECGEKMAYVVIPDPGGVRYDKKTGKAYRWDYWRWRCPRFDIRKHLSHTDEFLRMERVTNLGVDNTPESGIPSAQ